MKNYIIKCYRCKTRFEGSDFDEIVRSNNLKPFGKLWYCECKGINKIIEKKISKKELKKSFWSEDDNL